jgi:hypothetical protein
MPVNTYSAGMRVRLAFGTCLATDFQVYLIDEVTEIGDDRPVVMRLPRLASSPCWWPRRRFAVILSDAARQWRTITRWWQPSMTRSAITAEA